MSKINRHEYITFGLIAAFLLSVASFAIWEIASKHAEREIRAHRGANSNTQWTESQIQQICASRTTVVDAIECMSEYTAPDEETKRANYDLQAQTDMAAWAFWMLIATFITTGITGLALLLLAYTLIHTRRAADSGEAMAREAERTRQAAIAGNNNAVLAAQKSDEHARRQLRAYINVQGAEVIESNDPNFIRFSVTFKNSGQTPAHNATIRRGAGVFQADLIDKDELPVPLDVSAVGPVVIAPNEALNVFFSVSVTKRDIDTIKAGNRKIALYGVVEYEDVFDITIHDDDSIWFTQFQLHLIDWGGPNERVSPFGKSNEAT